jgi:hypothetical protein
MSLNLAERSRFFLAVLSGLCATNPSKKKNNFFQTIQLRPLHVQLLL